MMSATWGDLFGVSCRSRLQHLMEHGPAEEPAALPAAPTAAVDTSQNGQAHAGPSTRRPASAPSANGAAARPALRAGGAADTLACARP